VTAKSRAKAPTNNAMSNAKNEEKSDKCFRLDGLQTDK